MRRQLALLVAATTALVVLAFLLPLTLLLRTLAEDRAVAQAVQEAQNLAVLVAVVADEAQLEPVVTLVDGGSAREVTVFLPDGAVLGAPVPETAETRSLAARGQSFTADTDAGREVFVPVDTPRGRAVVRSLVPDDLLHRGVAAATAVLAGLALVLLLVAVAVADRLARGTVRPVSALAAAAHRLAAGDLSARVTPDGPPEVREVGDAVNALGGRIGELLEAERETVADLSHRLRTPLTALRLDVEGLRDRAEAARLSEDVTAVEQGVDEVIRSARRSTGAPVGCDAGEVVGERAAFWSVLAEDQDRPWALHIEPGSYRVGLTAEDLAAAVDALLGNVFAHTPDDAAVDVSVRTTGAAVLVEVADRGPGLRPGASVRGRSTAGSTGLGLDIARRTAERAGGSLELSARPAGGTQARMHLPHG